ncbi:MAG: CDP-alcohol phosphatidyltransferase family protein [Thermodesulfovibrionales bacterium]|nr:CDP-alcohol phosphatidyltransferase family protein [Thermodesulfovibrionales bacterium]MDP3112072.1 CDP-alcohol phosphatidyltransferase family protein [Thermodesulfovibrionales bacterium]
MGVLNLPNTITIARIVIIPLFITTVIYKRYDYALYLFVIAALTDALDGLIARLTNQKTVFGTFLDPLADKFLLVTSFILFSMNGWLPKWLTITVISRDIIVIIGWVLIYLTTHISNVQPTITGKAAIAMQLIVLCYVLLTVNIVSLPKMPDVLILVTAALTIISGLHYIYRGLKLTHAQ